MSNPASLSYHEPDIESILILSSFLLLLNTVPYVLDRIVYCGLIGQIFIGVGWGVPGAGWLSREVQDTVMQLGYLGLILIVYEGGLSTNIKNLKANLALSALVAFIGISAPIGLSFVLQGLLPITSLQVFAAGAALCSTSLGTTFTVLSTSGLTESRLGVVLTTAAMMDDVVGLIMVQVISNIGGDSDFDAITVVRPVLVSIAFAVVVPLVCLWAVKPFARRLRGQISASKNARLHTKFESKQSAFVLRTGVLLAMVAGSTFAGTSNLFAAYLAGASMNWFDGLIADQRTARPAATAGSTSNPLVSDPGQLPSTLLPKQSEYESRTGIAIFESCYQPAVDFILKPFFFASIGFSIPITKMFTAQVVWRGIVYAALMAFGKLLCGACLIRLTLPWPSSALVKLRPSEGTKETTRRDAEGVSTAEAAKPGTQEPVANSIPLNDLVETPTAQRSPAKPADADEASTPNTSTQTTANTSRKRTTLQRPRSLYPAAILGSAMVARGEIGFLISSVAESNGVYGVKEADGSSEMFLIVTWAILICTLLGPVTMGLMVRRVRRLQEDERKMRSGKADPLGIWGVVPTGM